MHVDNEAGGIENLEEAVFLKKSPPAEADVLESPMAVTKEGTVLQLYRLVMVDKAYGPGCSFNKGVSGCDGRVGKHTRLKISFSQVDPTNGGRWLLSPGRRGYG